jgi:hypothetical protein
MIRSLLALAVLLVLAGPAAAQVPSYISSMSDYQVRAMSGSFAPTNGTSSMSSVTPAEWFSEPGALEGVITAWSGGFKGETGTKLYVHGGGHSDSANNGVYAFDFSGTTRPTGWVLTISSTAAIRAGQATYSDGRPVSVHTYDGAFLGNNGFAYRFGGSPYRNGFLITAAFKFNTSTNAWTQLSSLPGGSGFTWPVSFYDSTTNKALIAAANSLEYRIFRLADDTYSAVKTWRWWGATADGYHTGCFDPTRSRGVWFGSGSNQLVTVNWTAETARIADQSIRVPSGAGMSCVYDATMDRYWVLGGPTGSSGWSTIYEVNPQTFAVTTHALSGDTISQVAGMIGSFGRVVFMPTYRAIGIIANYTSPAYVIKLPGSVGGGDTTAPVVPSAVP